MWKAAITDSLVAAIGFLHGNHCDTRRGRLQPSTGTASSRHPQLDSRGAHDSTATASSSGTTRAHLGDFNNMYRPARRHSTTRVRANFDSLKFVNHHDINQRWRYRHTKPAPWEGETNPRGLALRRQQVHRCTRHATRVPSSAPPLTLGGWRPRLHRLLLQPSVAGGLAFTGSASDARGLAASSSSTPPLTLGAWQPRLHRLRFRHSGAGGLAFIGSASDARGLAASSLSTPPPTLRGWWPRLRRLRLQHSGAGGHAFVGSASDTRGLAASPSSAPPPTLGGLRLHLRRLRF